MLGFSLGVPPEAPTPSKRPQDCEAPSLRAARIWLGILARGGQKDTSPFVLPTKAEVVALCRHGQADVLLAYVEQQLQADLQERHMAQFWARLETAVASHTSQKDTSSDQVKLAVSNEICGHSERLASELLLALRDLSSVVESHCSALSSVGAQLLDSFADQPTNDVHELPKYNSMDTTPSVQDLSSLPPPALVGRLDGLHQRYRTFVCSVVQASATVDMQGLLQNFLARSIGMLQADVETSGACNGSGDCEMTDNWLHNHDTEGRARSIRRVQALGMTAVLEQACTRVVYMHVQSLLSTLATGEFDQEVLTEALQHAQSAPMALLEMLPVGSDAAGTAVRDEWRQRLVYLVYEGLGTLRIGQLFDIIVDYPDSQPALNDIACCLRHTSLQTRLVTDLSAAISTRLLHAGAPAASIIHTYISTIKALRSIEPSGSLLAVVAEPIRRYLRSRPDAIKVLVAMVTAGGQADDEDVGGMSLRAELQKASFAASMSADHSREDPDDAVLNAVEADARVCLGAAEPPAAVAAMRDVLLSLRCTPPAESANHDRHSDHVSDVPVTAPMSSDSGRHSDDVIGMLTGVFGSVDVFIKEYRAVLSMQLLLCADYDCEAALCTTELLKLRFGEQALHACEVMLKDISDSKRTNLSIHAAPATERRELSGGGAAASSDRVDMSADRAAVPITVDAIDARRQAHPDCDQAPTTRADSPGDGTTHLPEDEAPQLLPYDEFSAVIVSHMFWPKDDAKDKQKEQESKLLLPGNVRAAVERYSAQYQALKTPRMLRWRPHQGQVVMHVEVSDVRVEVRVSPVLATLLLQFQNDDMLTAAELAVKVGLPQGLVRRRMSFWVNHGLVHEVRPVAGHTPATRGQWLGGGVSDSLGTGQPDKCPAYARATALSPDLDGSVITDENAEDDATSNVAGPQDVLLEVMAPYENYIMGMLTTYKQLPLDRLHHMLKLFVISPKYDKSVDQLGGFLANLIAQGKVVLDNNLYRCPAAPPLPSEN